MTYGIRINSRKKDTYIEWCNTHWYKTIPVRYCIFTEEQAMKMIEYLKNHYVYSVTLVASDGTETIYNCLKNHKSVSIVISNEINTANDEDDDFWSF